MVVVEGEIVLHYVKGRGVVREGKGTGNMSGSQYTRYITTRIRK